MAGVKYVKTYKKRIRVGFDGIVNSSDESVTGLAYAKSCHNFAFEKGVINGKIGIDPASGYYVFPSLIRHEYPTFATDKKIVNVFHYRKLSDSFKRSDDRLVVVLADTSVWYTSMFKQDTWHQFGNFYLSGSPDAVNYNYKSNDVLLVSSCDDGLFIVNDHVVSYCSQAPKFSSIAVHNERVFGTVSGVNNQVWFSDDFDPSNWKVSPTEGGYINFADDLGSAIKVVSFLNYLYVFRDYGILRLTAYGDQNDFIMKKVFTDTGRIYKDSIVLCGDKIMFCAEDGVYAFDGYDAVRVGKEFPIISDKRFVCGGYLENKYYLGCRLDEIESENNNAVVVFDTETKDVSVLSGVQVSSFCSVKSANGSDVICTFGDGNKHRLGMISKSGKLFGAATEKVYESPETTLGSPTYKTVRGASIFSKYPITLGVVLDGKEYDFAVNGGDEQWYIPVEKCGVRVQFKIKSTEQNAYVAPLAVDLDVERRTL